MVYSRVFPREVTIHGAVYSLAILMGHAGHISSKLHAFALAIQGKNVIVLDDHHYTGELPNGNFFTMQVTKVIYLAKKHCGMNLNLKYVTWILFFFFFCRASLKDKICNFPVTLATYKTNFFKTILNFNFMTVLINIIGLRHSTWAYHNNCELQLEPIKHKDCHNMS